MQTKRAFLRILLWILLLLVIAFAGWELFAPHHLSDTDQFGYVNSNSGTTLDTMDRMLFGAFVAQQPTYQTSTWHTYQTGPMTIQYRNGQSGFDTIFTKNNNSQQPMMYGYGYGDPLGGAFIMLLFWALIIAGAVVIVRYFMHGPSCHVCGEHHHGEHKHHSSALEILAERYARGEIDKDEYDAKKKDLTA